MKHFFANLLLEITLKKQINPLLKASYLYILKLAPGFEPRAILFNFFNKSLQRSPFPFYIYRHNEQL